MKESFVRFSATDDIELCGVLSEPSKKGKKAVVHVHGMAGNFFENRFVSYLEKMYVDKNYAFVMFNNRGYGYFSDLLKGKKSTVKGGAAYELFEECVFDIEGVIQYLIALGYDEFILEGHSYGCNKVVYAYNLLKEKYNITDIVLLAPCDVYAELKYMIKDYDSFLEKNKKYCEAGKGLEFVATGLYPLEYTAKTVVNNYTPFSESDVFKYRIKDYKSDLLNNISIPVHVVIGERDECVFTVKKDVVEEFLKSNIIDLDINYVENSKHIFKGQEESLVQLLGTVI